MVVQYGVVSAEYFLDKMQAYELALITEGLHLRIKDSWEQTRMLCHMIAQVNSKKRLKPKDIMAFPWEKEFNKQQQELPKVEMTKEYFETVKKQALEREAALKSKGYINGE